MLNQLDRLSPNSKGLFGAMWLKLWATWYKFNTAWGAVTSRDRKPATRTESLYPSSILCTMFSAKGQQGFISPWLMIFQRNSRKANEHNITEKKKLEYMGVERRICTHPSQETMVHAVWEWNDANGRATCKACLAALGGGDSRNSGKQPCGWPGPAM